MGVSRLNTFSQFQDLCDFNEVVNANTRKYNYHPTPLPFPYCLWNCMRANNIKRRPMQIFLQKKVRAKEWIKCIFRNLLYSIFHNQCKFIIIHLSFLVNSIFRLKRTLFCLNQWLNVSKVFVSSEGWKSIKFRQSKKNSCFSVFKSPSKKVYGSHQ